MADETQEIRARIDILELVGQRVSLKRTGKTWKGLCPFHEDRNPSFTVSPDTGRYKCWACGEGGDIFTWVMKTQNVDFREALTILARAAGVTLTRGSRQDPSQRDGWHNAMTSALTFFREQLSKAGTAREYCEGRGIDKALVDSWELGYAPDVGDLLAVTLKKKGLQLSECKQLFLVDEDSGGGYFDRFRGRLMFPIRDERGELVAFGGRILGEGHPKYINSGDTPLFRKNRVLYGLYRAKGTLQEERRAILVEGYLDVIACHQAGLTGALASLGTSLTEEHAKLLKRWCDEVVILYDSDEAGRKAALRAIDVLKGEGLRVRVALLPVGDDPDTLLKSGGPAALHRTVQECVSPIEYEIHQLRIRLEPTEDAFWEDAKSILSRANNLEFERLAPSLAPLYAGINDPIQAMKALRRDVSRQRRGIRSVPERRTEQARVAVSSAALRPAELTLFRAILSEEFRSTAWSALVDEDLLETSLASSLRLALIESFDVPPTGPPALWLGALQPEFQDLLSDTEYDARSQELGEVLLADTVAYLRGKLTARKRSEAKAGATTDEKNELLKQLKGEKPRY